MRTVLRVILNAVVFGACVTVAWFLPREFVHTVASMMFGYWVAQIPGEQRRIRRLRAARRSPLV